MATEAKIVLSAIDNSSRAFSTFRQNLSGVGTAIAGARTALAGLGALTTAAYLANVVNQARAVADQFNDLSDATGSSVENISALDRIARETGGNFEQVSSILVRFNQVLKDAEPDKGAGAVLKALNLDIDELKKLDPAEALRRTAVALQGFADDGNKARAVQELLGKSVRELAPILKDLAERNQLVANTSTVATDELDRFNKEMAKLGAEAEDLKVSLGTNLVIGFNALIDKFKEGKREGQGFLETLLKQTEIARLLGLNKIANPYTEARQELERVNKSLESGKLNAMQIRAFTEKRLELEQRIAGFLNSKAGAGRGVVNRDLVKPDIELPKGKPTKTAKAPRDASFAGLTYDEQIAQRVGRLLEESDVTKAKELADTMAKLDELYFSGAIGGKLYDAAMRSLAGSTSAAADKTSKFVQDQERLAELLSSTESAGIEAQRKDMQLLADAFERGAITQEQLLEGFKARLGLVAQETEKAKTFAEEFGLTFTSALEDAIVKGGDLSDVLKGLEQDILRIILRKQVTEPLGNFISSGVGDFFKNLFPSAKGNVFMDAPGLSAYSNSVVSHPTVFPFANGMGLMGEAGPEAIMPLTRLANGSLGVSARVSEVAPKNGAGQTLVVHQHFTVGDVATISMVRQAVAGSEARIASSLSRSVKYGGGQV